MAGDAELAMWGERVPAPATTGITPERYSPYPTGEMSDGRLVSACAYAEIPNVKLSRRRLFTATAAVAVVSMWTAGIAAGSNRSPSTAAVTISAMSASATSVPAAPDFATTAFSDPWDYSNTDDIHFEEPPQANSVLWHGLFGYDTAGTYPWFDPLPYFPGSLSQERDGPTHPIDADYYTRVSFYMYSSQSGYGGISWSTCDWSKDAACQGQMGFATYAGWHLYVLTPKPDQATLPAPWSGKLLSLRIIPIAAKPGTHIVVDWLRVFHPVASPVNFTVPVPTPGQSVTIMLKATGHQSFTVPIESVHTSGPTVTIGFDYSPCPPDSYQLYAVGPHGAVGAASSALNVTTPPTPIVDSPNAGGAGDLAAQTIGHPWDFSSMASVGPHANVGGLSILPGGVLRGQNAGPEINNPFIYLPVKPFSGSDWHHLTVRVKYDGPFGITGGATGGAVGRLIWYNASDLERDDQNVLPIILYPGWNTVTADLATSPPTAIVDPTQKSARIGWAGQTITKVRWDPNEDESGRVWYIDSIRIAGDPVGYGGATIMFHDPNAIAGETATAYLTTSPFGTDNVGSSYPVPVKAGSNSLHIFAIHGLGGRECWVRIVVNSANGTATQWSSGQIRIVS